MSDHDQDALQWARDEAERVESARVCVCGHEARTHSLTVMRQPGENRRWCGNEACPCTQFVRMPS